MSIDFRYFLKRASIILYWLIAGKILISFPAVYSSYAQMAGDRFYLEFWMPLHTFLTGENISRNILIISLIAGLFDFLFLFSDDVPYRSVWWTIRSAVMVAVLWPYLGMAVASFQLFVAAMLAAYLPMMVE